MFNLDTLALNTDSVLVHLRHPVTEELLYADAEKKKPVGIYVYGTASEKYRSAITAMQNRQLRRGKKQVTAEVMKEEAVELLVAVTDRAENLTYQGKGLDNAPALRALYSDPKFSWVREQVDAAVGDTANFLNQ